MMDVFTRSTHYFAACSSGTTLFGIPSWYSYLTVKTNPVTKTCDVVNFQVPGSFINIGLALLDMALHIAAIAAVAYVIYGGILLVMSRGEPDKAAQGRQAIINALIGLVIALISVGLVGFLGNKLG